MTIAKSFIGLEGLLDESMQFELLRGYESPIERQPPSQPLETNLFAQLLAADGQVLVRKLCDVRFPKGCSPRPSVPTLGLLRVQLALHPAARELRVYANERAIFSAPVGKEAPIVTLTLEPATTDAIARFRCKTSSAGNSEFAMVDEHGRQMPFTLALTGDTYSVDLRPYEGLGTGRLLAMATRDFRTGQAVSDPIKLPAGKIVGRIVEPANHAELCPHAPGSLIGNLSYESSGRAVAWNPQEVRWAIDGVTIQGSRQLAFLETLKPGIHTVELLHGKASEQKVVLDRVQVRVRDETPFEKEYAAVIARHRAALEIQPKPLTTLALERPTAVRDPKDQRNLPHMQMRRRSAARFF